MARVAKATSPPLFVDVPCHPIAAEYLAATAFSGEDRQRQARRDLPLAYSRLG